jgi:hypothetical protein
MAMVQDFQTSQLARFPIRFPGIPPEILINYASLIQEIIKTNRITPVSKIPAVSGVMERPQQMATRLAKTTTLSQPLSDSIDWWWKYGGIRAAHLHFGDDVYMLDETQWQTFSTGVLKDFAKKLNRVKGISFNQFVEVADAVNEIA